eukprot:NODE_7923_length_252_cov_109.965517_g7308_i0.p2 GENE.NODE_7923_length_252_cov_109.965517_g7308_i0~~NODE_7923_length_252_cov_109.965517_g7308_i0.p2  ORF type:complete len:52 (-),score=17.89 NODE_7923_length_252_cov_109.965517_g7308_i0:96-227(-)
MGEMVLRRTRPASQLEGMTQPPAQRLRVTPAAGQQIIYRPQYR